MPRLPMTWEYKSRVISSNDIDLFHQKNLGSPPEELMCYTAVVTVHLPLKSFVVHNAALILGLRPTNERRRYFVATSLIGWVKV